MCTSSSSAGGAFGLDMFAGYGSAGVIWVGVVMRVYARCLVEERELGSSSRTYHVQQYFIRMKWERAALCVSMLLKYCQYYVPQSCQYQYTNFQPDIFHCAPASISTTPLPIPALSPAY